MLSLLPLFLFGGFAAGQVVNCKSFGILDGYQGHPDWRASTKDCAEATNKLESQFGQTVPEASNGCVSLATSGECEISMCDSSDVRQEIPYEAAWLAARVVHGRHKSDGKLAGYISLDHYVVGTYKVFVKVAKKGTPDPSNKRRRGLLGRRSALDVPKELPGVTNSDDGAFNVTEAETGELSILSTRANDGRWRNWDSVNVPNTDGLSANIRVAWGGPEEMNPVQIENAAEYLLEDWEALGGARPGSVNPRGYRADPGTEVQLEWVAHNNHDVQAITGEERRVMVRWAITQRQAEGNTRQRENFGVQVRRAGQTLGFLIIRVFYIGIDNALANVCG